jgi:hypothetical protein
MNSTLPLLMSMLLLSVPLLPAADQEVVEDAAAVARLFAAGDPASVAWAAYHAARLRLAIAVPDIVAHLRDGAGKKHQDPEQVASRACAAALADLRQPVEVGVPALVWTTGCRAEAMYLAAIEPSRHEAWLIERLRSTDEHEMDTLPWLAAANLLALRRTPVATLALLQGLEPTLSIQVMDEGKVNGGRRRKVGCGDGYTTLLPGFPPLVVWDLTRRPEKENGVELLADGPVPVWVSRREQTRESQGVGSAFWSVRRSQYRTLVLESLLGSGTMIPALDPDQEISIVWPGRTALIEHAAQILAEQEARWAALTAGLVQAQLLPAGTPSPVVRLIFADNRTGDGLDPLPDPAAVPRPTP